MEEVSLDEGFGSTGIGECINELKRNPGVASVPDLLSVLSENAAREIRAALLRFEKTTIHDPNMIFESILEKMNLKKEKERLKTLAGPAARMINSGGGKTSDTEEFKKIAQFVKSRKT